MLSSASLCIPFCGSRKCTEEQYACPWQDSPIGCVLCCPAETGLPFRRGVSTFCIVVPPAGCRSKDVNDAQSHLYARPIGPHRSHCRRRGEGRACRLGAAAAGRRGTHAAGEGSGRSLCGAGEGRPPDVFAGRVGVGRHGGPHPNGPRCRAGHRRLRQEAGIGGQAAREGSGNVCRGFSGSCRGVSAISPDACGSVAAAGTARGRPRDAGR